MFFLPKLETQYSRPMCRGVTQQAKQAQSILTTLPPGVCGRGSRARATGCGAGGAARGAAIPYIHHRFTNCGYVGGGAGTEQLAVATAALRAVVLPTAQERRPPGPSRKEIVSAQQERRNFGRRLREGVDPMDPVRTLHHLLPFLICLSWDPLRTGRITSYLQRATCAMRLSSAMLHEMCASMSTGITACWTVSRPDCGSL